TGTSFLMVTRRAIRRSRKVRVAKTSTTAACCQPAPAVFVKIEQQLVGMRIQDLSADRDAHDDIRSLFARAIATLTMQSAPGDVNRLIAKMKNCFPFLASNNPNLTATTAVTSGRAAARHEFFTTKSGDAISTVTSLHANFCPVNEHDKSAILRSQIPNSKCKNAANPKIKNARPAELPSARASH